MNPNLALLLAQMLGYDENFTPEDVADALERDLEQGNVRMVRTGRRTVQVNDDRS